MQLHRNTCHVRNSTKNKMNFIKKIINKKNTLEPSGSFPISHVMEYKEKNEKGFVILFAVLLTSIILAIAVAIANVSFKEIILSSSARESHYAFYAADSGAECALYHDLYSQSAQFVAGQDVQVMCDSNPSTTVQAVNGLPNTFGSTEYTYNFPTFEFDNVNAGATVKSCNRTVVKKHVEVNQSGGTSILETQIDSYGYNVSCNDINTRSRKLVERHVYIHYNENGGSGSGTGGSGTPSGTAGFADPEFDDPSQWQIVNNYFNSIGMTGGEILLGGDPNLDPFGRDFFSRLDVRQPTAFHFGPPHDVTINYQFTTGDTWDPSIEIHFNLPGTYSDMIGQGYQPNNTYTGSLTVPMTVFSGEYYPIGFIFYGSNLPGATPTTPVGKLKSMQFYIQ